MIHIKERIGGLHVVFLIRDSNTELYFSRYRIEDAEHLSETLEDVEEQFVPPVDPGKLQIEVFRLQSNTAFAEYSLLAENFANTIINYDRFLFHGAAFIWHGRAFILTGKSGIGKTTQLRHWMKLYRDEIELINGDKPLIWYRNESLDSNNPPTFEVFPSPWTGKEGWCGTRSARLAAIICLEQGTENRISKMAIRDVVFRLFLQFLFVPDSIEIVDQICRYEEQLIQNVPVYKLVNNGNSEAAVMTHDFLKKEGF